MKKILFSLACFLSLLLLVGIWFNMREPAPQQSKVPENIEQPVPVSGEEDITSEPIATTEVKIPASTKILYTVPFTSQAPLAEWGNATFQNACEEAAVIMAQAWAAGETSATIEKNEAQKKIMAMSEWETKYIGHSIDTNAADTEKLLLGEYSKNEATQLITDFKLSDLIAALQKGIVIIPTNGQKLGNPNFKRPGPLTHMVVIIGYDPETKKFTTNDPGTRLGAGYQYDEKILFKAIRDYPTGKHLPIKGDRKAMIVVSKP